MPDTEDPRIEVIARALHAAFAAEADDDFWGNCVATMGADGETLIDGTFDLRAVSRRLLAALIEGRTWNTAGTTPLDAFRQIEDAVNENYEPEGARIWWINFGKADSVKRKRMIRAVSGSW